jgi:hypothetical protein
MGCHRQGAGAVQVRAATSELHLIDDIVYPGFVKNIKARNVLLDRVNAPIHLYQTNGGHSCVFRTL